MQEASSATAMPEREAGALLEAHLPTIDRVVGVVCARHGLSGADAEDFAGWVRLRLLENDCAILRKFDGRSSLTTFLAVVITNLYRDQRVREHGRWRPSAAARRHGPVAERLERLVYRQRLTFREAAQTLRAEGVSDASDRELAELLHALPVRPALRGEPVGEGPLARVASELSADRSVEADEERRTRDVVCDALARALGELPAEDRIIVRMRFWDGMTVAQIARGLGREQQPLYRRIDRLLGTLRARLLAAGVDAEQALGFIGRLSHAEDSAAARPSIREA